MLIIKVFVNKEQIDEINIHNMGFSDKRGFCKYEVKYKEFYFTLYHEREKGWKNLGERVIRKIRKLEVKNEI